MPVGDQLDHHKLGAQFQAIYKPVPNLKFFASAFGGHSIEQINDRVYDRYRLSGGLRLKF